MNRKGFLASLVGLAFAPKIATDIISKLGKKPSKAYQVYYDKQQEVWYMWVVTRYDVEVGDPVEGINERFVGIATRRAKAGEMLAAQISGTARFRILT